jgi:hypothetical protein
MLERESVKRFKGVDGSVEVFADVDEREDLSGA